MNFRRRGRGIVAVVRVSIPQSGFGAFEHLPVASATSWPSLVSIPQSGFGAFEPVLERESGGPGRGVSIPQSGFGAFELLGGALLFGVRGWFQSLSRDSGRLNHLPRASHRRKHAKVSIPQSGFGAFEPASAADLFVPTPSFNPSVGIRGV